MKRILAITLMLAMLVPMMSFGAMADAPISADTSWYTGSASTYTLTTAAQLYGFAKLSQTNSFAGITVKLGADITVNTGDSANWSKTAPTNSWSGITNFSGTFDGQNHTVSGLYASASSGTKGFFVKATSTAVIANFRLVNSYFYVGNDSGIGSVLAGGCGTIRNVYSNAIIRCGGHHAGGIFGVAGGTVTVEGCWFDGSVTIEKRYGAGIVGNGNGNPVIVTNCLNTGDVRSNQTASNNSHIGGIVGRNDNTTRITGCVNIGKVSSAYEELGNQDVIGSLMGSCSGNAKTDDGSAWLSHVSIDNSYASKESCRVAVGYNGSTDPSQLANYSVLPQRLLVGYGAQVNTKLNFQTVWTVDPDGAPVLRTFAEEIHEAMVFDAPTLSGSIKTGEGNGPKWTVTLTLTGEFSKSDVSMGLLVVPAKAIPDGHTLTLDDTGFYYNGKLCKVADIKASYLQESASNQVIASFVVTDLEGADALTTFTAVPYAIYNVRGGAAVEVYGAQNNTNYYRQAVLTKNSADAATKAQIEADLAPIQAQMGGSFPVSSSWTQMTLFETIPAVTFGTVGAPVDYGVENYVVSVSGASLSNYNTYCNQLVQFGFTKHASSSINSNTYNSSFLRGNVTVNVTYLAKLSALYVSVSEDLPLSDHLLNQYSQEVGVVANESLTLMQLWDWGNAILIQLKNGHFLMNDGATPSELPYFLDYLETLVPEGETPVIDGWFFSHMHWDHTCSVHGFVDNPEWRDRVIVEGFYFSEPNSTVKDLDPGVYGQIEKSKKAISLLKNSKGEAPAMYRPQTGQRLYFSDMSVDVLLCQEQIPSNTYYDKYGNGKNFNESSTWLRFNIGNQDVLIAGDTDHAGMQKIMATYDQSFVNFDVFFSFHHGSNTWNDFTNFATFKTVIHPYRSLPNSGANKTLNDKAINAGGEALCEGEGNVVLTFPYTVGSYKRLPGNSWIYNVGSKRP